MNFDSELNDDELDIIVKKICSSNNFTYIYWFSYITKNLSEENKRTLKNTIKDLNDIEFIDKYALYVDESIILEKYKTIEKFHEHLNEVKNAKNNIKDSILNNKKYIYKI